MNTRKTILSAMSAIAGLTMFAVGLPETTTEGKTEEKARVINQSFGNNTSNEVNRSIVNQERNQRVVEEIKKIMTPVLIEDVSQDLVKEKEEVQKILKDYKRLKEKENKEIEEQARRKLERSMAGVALILLFAYLVGEKAVSRWWRQWQWNRNHPASGMQKGSDRARS